jgi:hypothetical protein
MLVTELYNGQGLGNQIWCYVVTRILALKNNYDFGIMSPHKFKGSQFLEIDFGKPVIGGDGPEGGPPSILPEGIISYYKEKMTRHTNGLDISKIDNELLKISDNTKVDGNMQSLKYIKDYKELIRSWIKIKSEFQITNYNSDNICIIHIRGGDFKGGSAVLFDDYYNNAMRHMRNLNPEIKFYIITDDVIFSNSILPNIEIIGGSSTNTSDINKANHHIGGPVWMDWSILYNCKNVILSASSFSFWPIWLNNGANVIAPMYWADYKNSDGYWSTGDIIVDEWNYLNRLGELKTSTECLSLKKEYEEKNKYFWI